MSAVPLEPPARCREEVVDYLHLEFGESRADPDALKADELKYVGLFVSDGVPTYYWAYPVSKGPREYATWSVYANTHCLGMTGTAPDPATRITDPARLDVEGTYATRYADLAHWLAGQVAIFGSLQQMQRRLAK